MMAGIGLIFHFQFVSSWQKMPFGDLDPTKGVSPPVFDHSDVFLGDVFPPCGSTAGFGEYPQNKTGEVQTNGFG